MKLLIASDHGGFPLKKQIVKNFSDINFIDLGPNEVMPVDYPDYAQKLCKEILAHKADRGILICGSGQGMAISANRFKGIRAALCWNVEVAKLSREHNNSNVLCLGARLIEENLALEITKVWIQTPFEGGRHLERVKKIEI